MTNIAFVIASLKTGGGAEKVVSQLSFALNRSPYKVHILTFYSDKDEHSYSGHRESLNESLSEWKAKKMLLRAYKIKEFCRKNDIETVISFMQASNYPLALSRIFGNTAHIIISERNNPISKNILYQITTRLLYPLANDIVACTKALKHILQDNYHLKNVNVIYNPLDISKTKQLIDEPLPAQFNHLFNDKNFVFITVGRLSKAKNHNRTIRSFHRLSSLYPHARLIIVGKGPDRADLEKLINSLALQDSVFLIGNQDNVFPFLIRSQCFVFSSLREGFPSVLTEALSVNLPIISTDCQTGPREILAPELSINNKLKYPYFGSFGILVSTTKNNTKELSSIMEEIIKKPALKTQYLQGEKRLSDFAPEIIVNKWKELL